MTYRDRVILDKIIASKVGPNQLMLENVCVWGGGGGGGGGGMQLFYSGNYTRVLQIHVF